MDRMTLGLVYVLLEEMTNYVRLTNPWGSGDEETSDASPAPRSRGNVVATVGKSDLGTLKAMTEAGMKADPMVKVKSIKELSALEQQMIRAEFGGN